MAHEQARMQHERKAANKRLRTEFHEICKDPPSNISAGPTHLDDLLEWNAILMIPLDRSTPYANGMFSLKITCPIDFPRVPPEVRALTRIYHPNIAKDGEISGLLALLRHNWSPAITIQKIILDVETLLSEPNLEDVMEPEAAVVYVEERERYEETARDWTRRFAMGSESYNGDGDELDEKKSQLV